MLHTSENQPLQQLNMNSSNTRHLKPSNLQSRKSLNDTTRKSLNDTTRKSVSRRSSVLPAVQRRVIDPRPINDHAYQSKCIISIITYLTNSNYPSQLTAKNLSQPSGREFHSIISFLLQGIDPNIQLESLEQIPTYVKHLGYPFPVSKSALRSVSSPHSWPSLLAMLAWLVELLQYHEHVLGALNTCDGCDYAFYEYLGRSYSLFLNFEDENTDLEAELDQNFQQKNAIVSKSINELSESNKLMTKKIESLQNACSELKELEKKHYSLQHDIEKQKRRLASIYSQKETVATSITKHELALEECNIDLNTACTLRDSLRQTVDQQHGLASALHEQHLLEGSLLTLQKQEEKIAESISRLESTIDVLRSNSDIELQKLLEGINRLSINFPLNHSTSMSVDPRQYYGILSTSQFSNALLNAYSQISQDLFEANRILRKNRDTLNTKQEEISDIKNDIESLQQQESKLNQMKEKERNTANKQISDIDSKVQQLHTQSQKFQSECMDREAEIQEAQRLLDQAKYKITTQEQSMYQNLIMHAKDILANRNKITTLLLELHDNK